MISHQFVVAFQRVHISNVSPHFSHPIPQLSSEIRVTSREPLHESLCISVAASQSFKGAQSIRSPRCFSPRHQLQVRMKGLLKSGTLRGQQPVVKPNGSSKPIELQRFMCTLT